eukprot:TRINITY_DN10671_c0_g1_i1.p1 TRINITY_DN10671_c0_g1~~TRINITY_DN10671_c0_g1_i1.p1  ORF type:complete len:312 (+),score=112.46 TRINITY_DN10671_c0_g1_i1:141-1076(+)
MAAVLEIEAAIKSIFAVFDSNHDGLLDRNELTVFAGVFRKPNSPKGADNVDKILAAMDFGDSSGKVDCKEFEVFLQSILAAKFSQFDGNGNGSISEDEMIDVVNQLCNLDSREYKRNKTHFKQAKKKMFMRKMDAAKDGRVTAYEFQAFLLQEMNKELEKWAKTDGKGELPYMLRSAVNVNPGQVQKLVKKLEKQAGEKRSKAEAAGLYISPFEPEFDLVDPKNVTEMRESATKSADERVEDTPEAKALREHQAVQEQAATKLARRASYLNTAKESEPEPEPTGPSFVGAALAALAVVAIGAFAYSKYVRK